MNTLRPTGQAIARVHAYYAEKGANLKIDDIYVVWFCYILGGWKSLVSTNEPDGMYYEVTYNVDKDETYFDAYKKVENRQY